MTNALLVKDLVVRAGATTILDGISLSVPAGGVVAIVGPNGAGKTTLLDAISGVTRALRGTVTVNATGGGNGRGPRHGVGRAFQGSPLPETLTVAEVTSLVAGTRDGAQALMDRFGLGPHASSFVSELSTGMRRVLDLAVATVGSPELLLLDEPASGLAQSEVEHLAELLIRWRDESGAAVILVEHDTWLVRAVADEVVVMDAGRIVAQGSPKKVLKGGSGAIPRLRSPLDPSFREALARVEADAAPATPLIKRSISTWTLMRLGLREFAAGLASVLLLGVLNRVLKVELGVSLGVVAAVLASYNLAAPIALAVGHRSDTRPIFGRRRTPYILGGAVVAGLALAAAPHVAGRLADGVTLVTVGGSLALFIAMGIGMYGAGTVFFALLADLTPERDRAHAVSVVYLMLTAGIFAGVALTGGVIEDDASNIGTLFGIAGILVVVLSAVAVWGQERRVGEPEGEAQAAPREHVRFLAAIRSVAAMRQARVFFAFLVLSTIFLFLQQAVLEPYGGDVLGLSIRQTSAFSAMMTIGILIGMAVAGRPWAAQFGHKRLALVGLVGGGAMFGMLAVAAATRSVPPSWFAILGVGLSLGVFNVASLALMMGMADRRRTALFMGAWTVAHAIADGLAVAGGGLVFEAARLVTGGEVSGYAAVFALEAVGLLLCLPLLQRVEPGRFAAEAASSAEALLGPAEAALLPESATMPPETVLGGLEAGRDPRSGDGDQRPVPKRS